MEVLESTNCTDYQGEGPELGFIFGCGNFLFTWHKTYPILQSFLCSQTAGKALSSAVRACMPQNPDPHHCNSHTSHSMPKCSQVTFLFCIMLQVWTSRRRQELRLEKLIFSQKPVRAGAGFVSRITSERQGRIEEWCLYNKLSRLQLKKSGVTTYLLQFVYHVFNANICSLQDFAFHLYQPGAQLLILFIEHNPRIEPVLNLLLMQRHLWISTHINS